jgi:gliding motility-associated-like protein
MKKVLLFSIMAIGILPCLQAQVTCNATSFDVDLSASIDTTVSFQSTRNGNCCTGNNCIRFNLTLNPACSYVNFSVANPAPPGNAAYYQIDCGTPTSLGTPICIVGKTSVVITFCKPGNDNPIYTITAAGALKGSEDITVREGCTASMNVTGLQATTINWTSIYPGTEGAYNSWLACTTGCATTNVTPQTGAPAYIDYKVSGFRLCGPLVSDTIRVYTTPQIAVALSPLAPAVCAGGGSSVTLTANASGGDAPYNFVWNNGQTGPSITVTNGNTYSVSVTDARNCLPSPASVVVSTIPLPATPIIWSNSPVCEGQSLQLSIPSVAGASYSWTGPNGFTSSIQNPVINNIAFSEAGTYSVVVTVGQCSGIPATTSVSVKAVPAPPSINSNSPVCEGAALSLSATNVAGAGYNWSGPAGFSSTQQNVVLNGVGLSNSGNYSVTATVNGCTSAPSSATVVINALPPAPVVSSNSPVCAGTTLQLDAAWINNAGFDWTGPGGFNASQRKIVMNNSSVAASGIYSVKATVNGCTGLASSIAVTVHPTPAAPVLSSNQPVCEGSTLQLSASTVSNASYNWSGPGGLTSTVQNPVITNASVLATGMYSAFITVNGCNSPGASISAIINPIPATPVISGNPILCEASTLALSVSPSVSTNYGWSGPLGFTSALPNISISNVAISNSGLYSVTATANGCTSGAATVNVLVNTVPVAPQISSNSPVCTGTSLKLSVAGVPGASYSWTGPNGFSSIIQNPAINNVSLTYSGDYQLTVTVNGCTSASPSSATVVVNQTPSPPSLTNNGPVCEGSDLIVSATGIAGASYSWWGPANFNSSLQNNLLSTVASIRAGTYYAAVTVDGCTSSPASTDATVHTPIKLTAGNDQLVCSNTDAINLSGAILAGNSNVVWSTAGTGSFSNAGTPGTIYFPSSRDKTSGTTTINLASLNNGACPAAQSSLVLRFASPPSADAGGDQVICADGANVLLNAVYANAQGGTWSTSGSGFFQPSAANQKAAYIPGTRDKTEGSVKLTWTTTGNGPCPAAANAMVVSIKQPPSINTGGVQYVLENKSTVLKPVVNGTGMRYTWTPALFLNSDTVQDPVCTPKSNLTYRLSVIDAFGCSSSADMVVKLILDPVIPNVFTPNGDGINDTWQIRNLGQYSDCEMTIYNRYGQLVHHCLGYGTEWNGSSNGKPLPASTYYYIIDLKTGAKPVAGFVDILR